MAGGIGSRFWPKSRQHFPKQFIDIFGIGRSLLQLTYSRFLNICSPENIYILGNEQYKGLIKDQIPGIEDANILLEPSRNNTAPCIAYATYKILKSNADANIVVAPSDHFILKEDEFLKRIEQALVFTEGNEALLTLGIKPTRPDTGYGYINFKKESQNDIYPVERFMEKPVLEKAIQFVESGDYLWNAGIFIWSGKSIKNAFKKYAGEIDALFTKGYEYYNTPEESRFISECYPKSPNISIDYAILEKANNIYTLPADIGWSDLGTWASLHFAAEKDENNNVLYGSSFNLDETENCIIHLQADKAAVIKGLKNYIIVDDGKILLIYPKADEQQIKQIAGRMVEDFGEEYL